MAGGHNNVEYCSRSHRKKSGFRSIDLSLALALSLGRGLRSLGCGECWGISPIQQPVASFVYPLLL